MRSIAIGTLSLSARAKRYVRRVLDTGRLSYGPFSRKFESLFAQKHDVPFSVISASGTHALHIALDALKEVYRWPEGSEVIVPATTFIATSNVVIHSRLKPVFVDVDPLYYSLHPDLIEKKITRRTRAILPVHLFGQPADMDPILAIARRHGLKVIEDSAETMFARYKGRSVGSLGDIGCFSTYVAHLLTTGVGGINTTRDPKLAVILRSLINHGRDSIYLNIDDDENRVGNQFELIIKKRFSFIRLGYSARITEMESALGLAQLEESFEKSIARRRAHANYLNEQLTPFKAHCQLPAIRPGNDHSFMVYPIVLRKRGVKRRLVNHLEKLGIETRDLMPLINQPIYQKLFRLKPADYPVSQWLIDCGFYIGCHQDLSRADLDYVVRAFRSFFVTRT